MKCKNVLCKYTRPTHKSGCLYYGDRVKGCDKRKLFNRVEARLPTHTIYVPDVESIRPMLIKARAEG